MADLKVVASGVCEECNHTQSAHEGNTTCDIDGCNCTNIGSY